TWTTPEGGGEARKKMVVVHARELNAWIETNIMLDLHKAPFRKDDRTLLPEAGACTDCPKRTGFLPALFPDVRRQGTCTDPGCYRTKVDAFTRQRGEQLAKGLKKGMVKVSTDPENAGRKRNDDVLPLGAYVELEKKHKVCNSTKKALVVEGENLGATITI